MNSFLILFAATIVLNSTQSDSPQYIPCYQNGVVTVLCKQSTGCHSRLSMNGFSCVNSRLRNYMNCSGPRIVQLICAPQLGLAKLVCNERCNNVTSNSSATVIFQGMYKL